MPNVTNEDNVELVEGKHFEHRIARPRRGDRRTAYRNIVELAVTRVYFIVGESVVAPAVEFG